MLMINKFFIITLLFSFDYSINAFQTLTRRDLVIYSPLITGYYKKKAFANNINDLPISVIGGSGYLGSDCVKLLSNNRINVRSISRNPVKFNEFNNNYIEYKEADVTNFKQLSNVLKDSSAVIYAVNAKKRNKDETNSQSYSDTCVVGLINTANICINYNIPRLIVFSASCISCNENPTNKVDKICGLKCEHCNAKLEGEKGIKELFANSNHNSAYTIIRTGLLTTGEKRGVQEIEINQDYSKSGMISRVDLADLAINSINNPNTKDTTFEAYYRDTIQPVDVKKSLTSCMQLGKSLEECFFGSYYKNSKPKNIDEAIKAPIKDTLFATGNEMNGKSWNELFQNLKKDKDESFDLYNINNGLI